MERNVRLYPWYGALRGAFFWLPVFFLYFLSVVSLEEALLLEAIYYVAVVVIEVPSGYFSDRVGRRITLLIGLACIATAAAVFALTASFAAFAVAQVLMAAGNAFNSGTDTALLYDSLAELGREDEIGEREGRALSAALASAAAAAAVGGLSAGIDLRIAYALTCVTSLAAMGIVVAFREPAAHRTAERIERPVRAVVGHLRDPVLRWTFAFAVGMVVLNHVPYEFFQPYLSLLFSGRSLGDYAVTPVVSGMLAAVMMLLGSGASRGAMRVRAWLGPFGSLRSAMVLQIGIIGAMGAVLSPWVMLAILLRSVPMGLLTPILNAEIHPRLRTELRATYLSVQSLAGRLAFAACLALSSLAVSGEPTSHDVMSGVLAAFAVGGVVLLAALLRRRS